MSNHSNIISKIAIDQYDVTPHGRPFIIAEVGINHNGELDKAKEMVRVAKSAGADVVKFQTFKAEEFITDTSQQFTYQSQGKTVTESMLEMFKRYEFNESQWHELKSYCDEQAMVFMSTPQNLTDLDFLMQFNIPAIKVGSDDFTNTPLLESYSKKKLPLIVSCGMSDIAEVHHALDVIGTYDGFPTILMLCTSEYPTPPENVNILKLKSLEASFPGLILGFSDHTQGSTAAIMAVAMGATVFETHFTLDHDLPGPDHWFSKNPEELSHWCRSIRDAYEMKGSAVVRPTNKELEMRTLARRSVVALKDINEGDTFTLENIGLRRPGNGLSPTFMNDILGKKASDNIDSGIPLVYGDWVK